MNYMKDLTIQAVNKNAGAFDQLKKLIGTDAASTLVKAPLSYTETLDKQSTKIIAIERTRNKRG